ncbi:hypothetical protein [Mesorhizobium sp. WSM4312]|uniref:hypothetical protein n=1 Tax=Mesorhizobium sp. WSM4312 TaxID=2029411 RepID=UPI00117D678D|nr:hypothetical protein [Mesorhizobium sp. WSM4312]
MQTPAKRPSKWDFLHRIGKCSRCIRQSFLAMLLSGAVFANTFIAGVLFDFKEGIYFAGAMALAFSVLFATHIVVFGIRRARIEPVRDSPKARSHLAVRSTSQIDIEKRRVMASFAKSAAVGCLSAAITAAFPRSAFANHICPGPTHSIYCSDGNICCLWDNEPFCCYEGTSCGPGYCNTTDSEYGKDPSDGE